MGSFREMGCFPCFDSEQGEQLGSKIARDEDDDHKRMEKPMAPPRIHSLSSRADSSKIKRNLNSKKESIKQKDVLGVNISAQIFTLRQLAAATKNFRQECFLGEGGFGRVYKGRLESTGQVVAIKQLDTSGLQGTREFLVEVIMLSVLHHPNLVSLIGYCYDGEQRLLVYEYMALGSLEDHLHDLPPDKEALDWNTRMKIAAGAARGLEHLHDKANPSVIYRDFKSANILLDKEFNPKLSDFGLAKLGPTSDKSHVSTRVMGTYGYCAPEYAMTGQLTIKSDVYSFGVVLLELITGRKAMDTTKSHRQQSLVAWARLKFHDRRNLSKLADPRLEGRYPMRGLYQALSIASMCIQEDSNARPLIADVVTALSYLASQGYDPSLPPRSVRADGEERRMKDETTTREEPEGLELEGCFPTELAGIHNKDFDRERAIAEAKLWGENLREKRRAAESSNE